MFKTLERLEMGCVIEFQKKIYYASTFDFFEYKKGEIERFNMILRLTGKRYFTNGNAFYKIIGLFLPDTVEADKVFNKMLFGRHLSSANFVLEKNENKTHKN